MRKVPAWFSAPNRRETPITQGVARKTVSRLRLAAHAEGSGPKGAFGQSPYNWFRAQGEGQSDTRIIPAPACKRKPLASDGCKARICALFSEL